MKKKLAAGAVALIASMGLAAGSAFALPGDPGIDRPDFRLNTRTLEPGCFLVNRHIEDVDLDTHIDFTYLGDDGQFAKELHITLDDGAPVSIDQVLVPSSIDGYQVYNTFDTGTVNNDEDIDPGQTAVDLFAPDSNGIDGPDPLDTRAIIVCVSDHASPQNEPYQQEAGGLVSAKNRPILQPVVSALGVSAIEPLNTYKVGFGYSVEKWYVAPSFDGAGVFPTVTDPNAIPSPTFLGNLPTRVRLDPREDGDYDARRVNDVDTFGEEFSGPKADYDQNHTFKQTGDLFAWSATNNNEPDTLSHLVTFTTQGDLPVSWTLRPSLASPDSKRTASLTDDQLRAWDKSWQAYYKGTGPKPTLPLAPGTNSPAPDASVTVIVNLPEFAPITGPPGPAGLPAQVVQQAFANAIAGAGCTSSRSITIKLPAGFAGRKAVVARIASHRKVLRVLPGRKVRVSFAGITARQGRVVAVAIWGTKKGNKPRPRVTRFYAICADGGVGQVNVPPRR